MAESISSVKEQFKVGGPLVTEEDMKAEMRRLEGVCEAYQGDERKAVQSEIAKAKKRITDKYEAELLRTEKMLSYEREYASYAYICGIDEAGRGPLAGPVCAGAVILPRDTKLLFLNDSKKLSASAREELFDIIKEQAVSFGIGLASPQRIDEINILQATYEAMRDAVSQLDPQPEVLLNDAVTIPKLSMKQVPIVHGDARSASIAAASILAKVTRDRIMVQYDELFPQYGFAGHKGYGSAEHIAALKKYGPTPIHRRSFIGHFVEV
ncbi:MAG: ribonuclease HII [Lachnospiraceae bacterium]|nr:ribonuclease HII [Lachnospiraceae bacterium]